MDTRAVTDIDLRPLQEVVRGRVVGPTDEAWDEVRQPWNRRVDQRPAAVVEIGDQSEVVSAVRYAAERELRVSAQPLGHGAGAPLQGTIVLRTGNWRGMTMGPAPRQVTVEPGARWSDLLAATHPEGLTGLPGTSSGLSVTGYSLHGGVGLLARTFGFAANDIAGAEVVTANGEVVRADENANTDLFWALRGGGGGFGVVVGLDIRLHPAPNLYGGQLIWSFDHARSVLDAWRQWTDELPSQLTSMAAVISLPRLPAVPEELRGRTIVAVTVCYVGRALDADRWVSPMRGVAPLMANALRPIGVADLGSLRFEPSEPLPTRIRSELLAELSPAAVDTILDAADPSGGSRLVVVELRHLGGALATPDPGHGAAGQLDAPFIVESVGFAGTPDQDAAIEASQAHLAEALQSCRTGATLPSLADPTRDADRVFDPPTRQRLRAVKARLDPSDRLTPTFRFLEGSP
jgi:FAD binding domain